MSAGRELQQQAVGQGMLPKPKGPSVAQRVQKAVDTNTTMIRTLIADGKERLDSSKEQNGKEQQKQAKADASEAQASETSTKADASTKVEPQQEALFDLGADTPSGDNISAAKKN